MASLHENYIRFSECSHLEPWPENDIKVDRWQARKGTITNNSFSEGGNAQIQVSWEDVYVICACGFQLQKIKVGKGSVGVEFLKIEYLELLHSPKNIAIKLEDIYGK